MSQLPIIDQILMELAGNQPPTPSEFSARLDKPIKQIYTFYWNLRKRGHVDNDNRITDAGRAYLTKIAADPSTAIRGGRPSKAPRPAKPQPAARVAATALEPVRIATGASERTAAVRELGTGLIDNAERSFNLLRAAIDDQVDGMSELLEESLDQLQRAIQLLRTGYKAAS
jgi:hypothetical protein